MKFRFAIKHFVILFASIPLACIVLAGCDEGEPPTPMSVEVPKDARPEEVTPGKPARARAYNKSSRLPAPPPPPASVKTD